ncbi:hypothetical protein [Alienimonas chondri]|uniref:Transmembrane protein n=1 Tax=Alienimonas chondri TaxID=2681879 RepID=A0ABX1VHW7_9PLAN|nr:hypothetical protein [Alienimonas chondri]NNJ27671.1 hypothetical protein [Alienimonas chondri]
MLAFELIMPAVFLLWLAATAALMTAGLRRWRWGTPGGALAAISAGIGLMFPVAILVTIVAEQVAPAATQKFTQGPWLQLAMGGFWLLGLWLAVFAAVRATRSPPDPAPHPHDVEEASS